MKKHTIPEEEFARRLIEQNRKPNVLYLCDQTACDRPCRPECKYTDKIEHALNFEKLFDNTYVEKGSPEHDTFKQKMEGLNE